MLCVCLEFINIHVNKSDLCTPVYEMTDHSQFSYVYTEIKCDAKLARPL